VGLEPVLAALLTLIGMGLTTFGVVGHVATASAPGALLVLGGGAWLGNALARRHVRLLPGTHIVAADHEVKET
jgi:hypothetical protein